MPQPQSKAAPAPDFIPDGAPDFIPEAGGQDEAAQRRQSSPLSTIRGGIDNLTEIEPANKRPGVGGAIETGLSNIGAAALSPLAAINHPVAPMKPLLPSARMGMIDSPDPDAALSMADEVNNALAHPKDALMKGLGFVESLPGMFALGEGAKPAGGLMKEAGAAVDNAVMGTPARAAARGANPGAALSTNRIAGSTPATLLDQVKERIPLASSEHRASIVANTKPGTTINTAPLVSDPFDLRVGQATEPTTGAATPAQVGKARLTQRILTHVPDPDTGKPTFDFRNPFLTPIQANDLKSSIYGMTDYDNPFKSSVANSALKGAAHNLKSAVETAVPESLEPGQRLHNLMSAQDVLAPHAMGTKLVPASKAGLVDRGITLGGTGAGAALDLTGSGLKTAAPYLEQLPVISLPAKASRSREKQSREE